MRTSTADNIRGRIYWLQSVWEGRVTPTRLHHDKLADMKTFCTLEVKNEFDKISYNTLKHFCISHSFLEITHTSENLWEYMRSLRANIYATLKKARTNDDIDQPTPEMKMNEAYNQAQLATYAYLELFRFFKTLVESDTSLNYATKTQITNFLYESSLRFEGIYANQTSPTKAWSVIQGGKGDA